MENDEEKISLIIRKEVSDYIEDGGFTAGVIKKVKQQRPSKFARRSLMLAVSLAGCFVACLLTWDNLATAAAGISGATELNDATNMAGITLVSSMILATALSAVVCLVARVDDVR